MSYLKVENLNKKFGSFNALNNINFEINEGEFVCFLGPSGCGKTTLLRIISGLEDETLGKIYLKDEDITNLPPAKRNFGIVFQSYVLFPNMTAGENIAYGLKNKKMPKDKIEEMVNDVLSLVGLLECKDKYPNKLSGGQQQRIAIARSIALSPRVLLLDEPLSALDAKVREHLRREIKNIQSKLGITTIMVTHDQEEALTMSDRIIVMNNSKIEQIGTPEEIYKKPANKFVADFVGNVNFFELDGEKRAIRPEEVKCSLLEQEDYLKGKIKSVEFRGAFYRIIVDLEVAIKDIMVDIISVKMEEKDFKVGDTIYLKLNDSVAVE
ncbi:MAG: ATP-binding cassette domain-containing protein [Clostridium cadaveris]|uniref:ABC transporter ATP-binding protein n=1 Tax=Clostridium cadaveris TaxID=1529 RepID=UPI0014592702|nr:ATP-binding cassette domain-containing protein [Clostridium cadaveris]MDY4948264.1 ATP-binding cassette domain-containing protein [Clostridium cadaveris]NME64015.1 ATP-binding cassette domain-containing protein [Clostridium cadaveris]NWK12156.1 ATP-binding cassette domain-containing protein [Clostridium cadaveris]UFH65512.1 ATP-binding cassette domain-containing protein [Clostridium cadaveris]